MAQKADDRANISRYHYYTVVNMNARKIGYGLTQAKQTTTQFCLCIMIYIKQRGSKRW